MTKKERRNEIKIRQVFEVEIFQDVRSASKNISNAYDKGHKDRSQRKQHSLRSKSSKYKDVSQVTGSVGYSRVKSIPACDHQRKPKSTVGYKLVFNTPTATTSENDQQHLQEQERNNIFKADIKGNVATLSEPFVPNTRVGKSRYGQNAGYDQIRLNIGYIWG